MYSQVAAQVFQTITDITPTGLYLYRWAAKSSRPQPAKFPSFMEARKPVQAAPSLFCILKDRMLHALLRDDSCHVDLIDKCVLSRQLRTTVLTYTRKTCVTSMSKHAKKDRPADQDHSNWGRLKQYHCTPYQTTCSVESCLQTGFIAPFRPLQFPSRHALMI